MTNQRDIRITSAALMWFVLASLSALAGLSYLVLDSRILIAATVLIVNIVLLLKYPMWGLLSYLTIFLMRPGEMFPALAPMRVELLTGVGVLIAVLIKQRLVHHKFTFPTDRVTLTLLAFLAAMCLSIFTSVDMTVTKDECIDFIKTLIFYYLIIAVIDTRKKLTAFLIVFTLLIAYIALDALRAYLAGEFIHTMDVDRMTGSTSAGGDPNTLAATLGATVPIVVAIAMYFRSWLGRALLGVLAFTMSSVITLTASRSGMLAFLGVVFGGWLFARRKAAIAVAIVLLLVGGWSVLPDQYRARYMTLSETDDLNDVSSGRWDIWMAGVQMIIERPFLGVGAGAFANAAASGDYGYGKFMRPHNLYVQLQSEMGIIGTVTWFAFIYVLVRSLKELLRLSREVASAAWTRPFASSFLVAMMALFISGVFGHNLMRYTWYMMAGLTVAMSNIATPRLDTEAQPLKQLPNEAETAGEGAARA